MSHIQSKEDLFKEGQIAPTSPVETLNTSNHSSQNEFGLFKTFNKDTLQSLALNPATQISESKSEPKSVSESFMGKISSWLKPSKKADVKETTTPLSSNSKQPISPIPVLDPPDHIPSDMAMIPNISKKPPFIKNSFPSSKIVEGLAQMSELTLESIMFIVCQGQIELEKEIANIGDSTYHKYIAIQKIQQQVLSDIKDVLEKDKNLANHLQTAQNIAAGAAMLSGIATTAIAYGLLGPVGAHIAAIAGPQIASTFITMAATIGTFTPLLTGGLTAFRLGSKACFKDRFNTTRARHEDFNHQNDYYTNRIDDAREHIKKCSDSDDVYKTLIFRFLKKLSKMIKVIFKK